jgi:uracil-DNA glycosylase family 4
MSLDLDKRQRAMLREMGVRVWQPQAATAPAMDTLAAEIAINKIASIPQPAKAEQRFVAAVPAAPLARAAVPAASPPAPLAPRDSSAIASMGWPELQAAVAGCTACPLCQSRKNTVFGVGPLAPVDWLIVGEAPGETEDLAGEPFVGAAGKLLDNMLQAMRLQRGSDDTALRAGVSKSVFITNVLKCRPPGNRSPEPAEVAQCAPYLKRQVELLQPKMILALGKFAAQSLLQDSLPEVHKTPLGKLRGQVHRYLGVPVVVSYHPAYLLRSLPDKARAWDDLCLAMDALKR